MTWQITIRDEKPEDITGIGRVTIDAFTSCAYGHHGEAELVDLLRIQCAKRLSLVAWLEDEIVGHILFTTVVLHGPEKNLQGMGLAPMSVVPNYQRTGVGKALVTAGLQRLSENGCPFVVVLGHPEYYGKFGFQTAEDFGISHGFAGIPQEVFLVKFLSMDLNQSMNCGKVFYQSAFGPQHANS